MHLALWLLDRGLITEAQLVEALRRQIAVQVSLGCLALQTGKLSVRQLFEILAEQADSQAPFGEIAMRRGWLSRSDLAELLPAQQERLPRLRQILVEIGAIEPAVLEAEWNQFHASRSEAAETLLCV